MTGYPAWPELFRWLTVLKDRVEQLPSISAEQVITGTLDPSVIPPIPWDRVLKAGSSLADLEIRSAAALSSGILPDARMPALSGDVSSVAGTAVTTLATVNLSPGTYGAGMTIPIITVNEKGLVTASSSHPIAGSPFTPGSVIFAGSLGQFAQDNAQFFWDDSTHRLGLGTTGPTYEIDILATTSGPHGLRVKNASVAGGNTHASIFMENSSSYGQLFKAGTGYGGYKNIQAGDLGFFNITAGNMSTLNDVGNINFSAQGAATPHFTLLGFGAGFGMTSPAAWVHLGAGTATASTAPLKFTSGTLLTSTEAGAVEFLTDAWYGTITTGAARKQFLLNDGTAFTVGSVPFATTNGRLTEDNANFFWDVTNHRLGIGNAAPANQLDVALGTTANARFYSSGGPANGYQFAIENTNSGAGSMRSALTLKANGANRWFIGNDLGAAGVHDFFIFGGTVQTHRLVIDVTGNVGIGTSSPSAKLDVSNGRAYFRAAGEPYAIGINQFANSGFFYLGANNSATPNLIFSNNAGTQLAIIQDNGNMGIGATPTAVLHLKAGTATASTAPLKFTSGTLLTTAEAGAVEYNGANLFFTRAGTVRENVLVAIDNVTAPSTSVGIGIVNFYGAAATNFLGDPNRWLSVNVLGSTYKIPLYT